MRFYPPICTAPEWFAAGLVAGAFLAAMAICIGDGIVRWLRRGRS